MLKPVSWPCCSETNGRTRRVATRSWLGWDWPNVYGAKHRMKRTTANRRIMLQSCKLLDRGRHGEVSFVGARAALVAENLPSDLVELTRGPSDRDRLAIMHRSEEHTSEL